MPKLPRIYTRLTRPAASVASYQSLWLASDHLLVVTSTGYTEEYRKFQLRDIKGFFLLPSDRRLYWNIPWGIIAAFSAMALGLTLKNGGTPVASPIFLGGSVVAVMWNYLLGPTCRTFVVTGVQTAPLPSLKRRRKTRKVLARLEPMIRAAQADLVVQTTVNVAPASVLPSASLP